MKYYDMAFRWGPFVFATIVFLVIILGLGGVPSVHEKVPITLFSTWLAVVLMLSEIDLDKRISQLLRDFAAIGLWICSIILFWLLREYQGYFLWILACTLGIAYIRLDLQKGFLYAGLLLAAIVLLDAIFALPLILSHIMLIFVLLSLTNWLVREMGGELVATRGELSKNRREVGQLAQANVRLQNQAIQYKAAAVADERNRVAREIHDSLGHVLTGVSVKLQTVEYLIRKDPPKASEEIAGLHTMVQMALRETRSVVFGLREPGHEILHGRDLWVHLCEVFTNCTGVEFEIDIPEEFNDVDDVTNAIVYRFIQEGITNAYRHGEASLIGVAVWRRDNMFRARVSDNGHGAKVVREGFGLTGIRERVNEIDGYMEWYSESGKGFDILIVFPMQGGRG